MAKLQFRLAGQGDVAAIRHLLTDDDLGRSREDMSDDGLQKYIDAFHAIKASPDNELWVATSDEKIIGTWQVTYIPYLSRGGNTRCLIEAVRTAHQNRGQGAGRQMMMFALDQARKKGCAMAQLTTDKTRHDAHRFYLALGFQATHEGMKIQL
ncbi:MAG TPA: GNAT family N-acetyltransferase [Rhizobiales bacterium]|nr:GNAT family N-acetyltransferase [Hyphomicrobiales bacterium]